MAINPTTPGVYVNEVSTLPASIAGVATGIPAFIGYTELGTSGVVMTPVRITSMLEYEAAFGGAYSETFTVTLTGTTPDISVSRTTTSPNNNYRLYYNMQMYFANGGGPCWVISVGKYGDSLDKQDFKDGIDKLEEIDEPSIICVPENIMLSSASDRASVNNYALQHCARLQDKFALIDVLAGSSITSDSLAFRNDDVGINNLKYGAAYYPSFDSALSFRYSESAVTISSSGSFAAYNTKSLATIKNGSKASASLKITDYTKLTGDNLTIGTQTFALGTITGASTSNATAASAIKAAIDSNLTLQTLITTEIPVGATDTVIVTAKNAGAAANAIAFVYADSLAADAGATTTPPSATVLVGGIDADMILYNRIVLALSNFPLVLYPSASIAGIYASTDRERGVWKAPANVSVNLVDKLSIVIDGQSQGGLNVDATSGKSINALRLFTGKGNLVWGARTLAGNDNEWRYINVRRLFTYVEVSARKAMATQVFEANDKNTWVKMKGMLNSFLSNLWAQGALMGSKAENAFFVHVGIGETMTADDVLNGKCIIRIGMAAVRPAEFIILEFQHEMPTA